MHTSRKIDAVNVDIPPTWKVLHALQKSTSVRSVIKLGTSQACAHQLTPGTIQAYDSQSDSEGSDNSFCLQLQIKHVQAQTKVDKKPTCLITNLLYRHKMHENRNLYLLGRLDTCTDVNIMPASVYRLVFQDPNLEKLIPNKLQIGTYTNDTVKIVGTFKSSSPGYQETNRDHLLCSNQ